MFYYLNGVVAHMAPFLAVIDCGGVGYACRTTNNTLSHLQKGKPAKYRAWPASPFADGTGCCWWCGRHSPPRRSR